MNDNYDNADYKSNEFGGRAASSDYQENGNRGYKKPIGFKKRQAFEVEENIIVKLDPDLAWALAEHIINTSPQNPAVMALGRKLEEMTSS